MLQDPHSVPKQWWVASEDASPIRSSVVGADKVIEEQTQKFMPMGRRHAARDGSEATACGRLLVGLHLFPALPWSHSALASRNCPACRAETAEEP
jgi:hypothetical protein